MKYLPWGLLVLVLMGGFAAGCGVDKAEANKVASAYFEAIKISDFETALTYYSEDILGNSTIDAVLQDLKSRQNTFGDLISYKQRGWTILHSAGDEEHKKGNTYIFKYDLVYTKFKAVANLTLFQPDPGNTIRIQGYVIKSSAPLGEIY
jgi:hypothetical protein